MLHGFAACDDAEIRETVRREFGALWRTVERVTGASPDRVKRFLAMGMLLNDAAAMDLEGVDEPWARTLLTQSSPESW